MAAAQQALAALRKHVPLIKFRKGSKPVIALNHDVVHVEPSTTKVKPETPSTVQGQRPTATRTILEDWQMPMRYRRAPLSQEEIDYINRGGPA